MIVLDLDFIQIGARTYVSSTQKWTFIAYLGIVGHRVKGNVVSRAGPSKCWAIGWTIACKNMYGGYQGQNQTGSYNTRNQFGAGRTKYMHSILLSKKEY